MKPTLKSINAALPRINLIRRNYMFHGETGFAHGYGFFASAYADLDKDGNVEDIRIYAVGDALERRHYYGEEGTVDITDQIERVLLAEDDHIDPKHYRSAVCRWIQDAILATQQPKMWWIIDDCTQLHRQVFTEPLKGMSKAEAKKEALERWNALSEHDRKGRDSYYIGYAAPDTHGYPDYDTMTDIISIK